jgi:hypothetical protein
MKSLLAALRMSNSQNIDFDMLDEEHLSIELILPQML